MSASQTAPIELSQSEAIRVLRELNRAQFIGIVAKTFPIKSGEMKDRVHKVTSGTVLIGFRYQNSVNNELEKLGLPKDFTPGPRAWGKHIEGTPLLEHKGLTYLETRIGEKITETFYLDGVETPREEIPGLKAPRDEAVKVRDFQMDSIKELRIQGKNYIVK